MNVRDTRANAGNLDPSTRLVIEKDPPGATSSWLIPGPYNGNDITPFNKNVTGFIRYLYETNSEVRNAVRTFRKHILKSGIVIETEVCGKKLRFNQEDKDNIKYYTEVLLRGVEHIITDWILYGYSVVRIFPPSEEEPLPHFTVMRSYATEEYIEWKDDRRYYKLVYSQAIPGPNAGRPVPGGMILMLHPPADNGMPDTELSTVLEPLARSDFLWSQYINSAYYSSHPPFVTAPEPHKGGDALAAKVSVWGGNAYLGGAASAQRDEQVNTTLGELAVAMAKSIHTQETMPSRQPTVMATAAQENQIEPSADMSSPVWRIASSIDPRPWTNGTILHAGERLQPAPRSTAPEKFVEIQEEIVHKIYRAVGIPPEMLSSAHQKHAANVEQTTAELRTNIAEFQGKARTQLSYLFSQLFSQLIDSKICAEATRQKKEKDVSFLKMEKARARVDFQFEYNPIVTPELLFSYHDQGVIRPEKFQEYALMIAGMPQDAREPNLEKAMQRKLDMQAKAKAKTQTAGQNKPGGGGAKKTASSSSSKTSSSSSSGKGTKRKQSTANTPSTSAGSSSKTSSSSSSSSSSNKKQKT